MKQLITEELPYQLDSAPLFASLLDLEQPVYLDSARPFSTRGRYDIFSAAPVSIVKPEKNILNTSAYKNNINYFSTLRQSLDEHIPAISNDYHLPFIGGAIGYLSYDLGQQLEQRPIKAKKNLKLPDAAMGLYSWAVIVDHGLQRCLLVAHPCADKALLNEVRVRLRSAKSVKLTNFTLDSAFTASHTKHDYQQAFNRIQHYIHAGDCYQINLAQMFSTHYTGSPWLAYLAMREIAAAPYSAYMRHEDSEILCLSPERFLHVGNQRVTTSPIKGTIGRGHDRKSDEKLARQLLNSSKDHAENLMIVDLLRNDLGKSCLPGSIQVDELFKLQSFETVHHLVSTISGQLHPDKDPIALLTGCFPGGSITGAPKVRAMEIIEELEVDRRSIYCGSMGYISCDGQMDLNITIRTMLCEALAIYCWAGGAIVADSNCTSEYQECFTKVEKLMAGLTNRKNTHYHPAR